MKKAIAILAAAAMATIAGQTWVEVDDSGIQKLTHIVPISKHKVVTFGYDNSGSYGKNVPSKVIIHQENPCLVLGDGYKYEKIDEHTAVVYDEFSVPGFMMSEERDAKGGNVVLGEDGCESKGREDWTIYQKIDGKWKFIGKTYFIFQ